MAIKKWETISREDLLRHPRMHVVEDEVRLPNGKTIKYVRQAPNTRLSVAVIAINDQGELLLQREYSYPPNEIMWQLPGGGVENGEEIIEAAMRELSEESGYVAAHCKILGYFYTNNRRSDQRQYIVEARDVTEKKTKSDPEEFIENHWLPIDKIKAMIPTLTNINLQAALNLWLNGKQ